MRSDLRVVAPFRPFPPEAPHHQELHAFDWMAAIRMMSDSATRACACPVQVLTDVDTDLPFPTLHYVTMQRRLMLWYLEIAACYLASDDFDRDTIMVDSDQLIFGNLGRWFSPGVDLAILVREPPKGGPGFPILNGVQFWAVRGKDRLAAFYRAALAYAESLPEEDILWGADTLALGALLAPLAFEGVHDRAGLDVRFIDSDLVLKALSGTQIRHLTAGHLAWPTRDVLDFRNTRKVHMQAVYDATLGRLVEVSR